MAFRALRESETSPRTRNREEWRQHRCTPSRVTCSRPRALCLAPLSRRPLSCLDATVLSGGCSDLESFSQPLSSPGLRPLGMKGMLPGQP